MSSMHIWEKFKTKYHHVNSDGQSGTINIVQQWDKMCALIMDAKKSVSMCKSIYKNLF